MTDRPPLACVYCRQIVGHAPTCITYLAAAMERIRPATHPSEPEVCRHCFDTALASEAAKTEDTVSIYTWPCPTIRALDKPTDHTIRGGE
jgi:hypothetical protein